jgi:hypothetical protein
MFQIFSGKFFRSPRTYDTVHSGIYYTNYRLPEEASIETQIGRLRQSAGVMGIGTLAYELTEKIEWQETQSGVMTSTGGYELKEEFADVISFALNIICTTDQDLCRWLILPKAGAFDALSASTKFLPRVFNAVVAAEPGDAEKVASLTRQLIGLPRKTYETAIKAIRQYVAALQSVGSDATLAYSLLITSVESLSQAANVPDATWDDFDQKKRTPIDDALEEAPPGLAEAIRNAILESEHVAIARRFREFIKSHIAHEFYRAEAATAVQAINRQDLDHLLRDAYAIRCGVGSRSKSLLWG